MIIVKHQQQYIDNLIFDQFGNKITYIYLDGDADFYERDKFGNQIVMTHSYMNRKVIFKYDKYGNML